MSKLPSIVSQIPNDLRQFLERIREAFTSGGLDGIVTRRDLVSTGLVTSDNSGKLTPVAQEGTYCGTPPAATNLTASGALANIMLEWEMPTYPCHAYAEIWASENNDLGQAVQVGMSPGKLFTHNVGGAATRYYWVRLVNTEGTNGAFNAVAGTVGSTSQDPAYLLTLLSGQLSESSLTQALNARINLVDGSAALSGSVSQRIAAEATARANAITAEANARQAAITTEENTRQAADNSLANQISTLTSSVDTNTSAIQNEVTARSTADSAEASSRELLATQLRGDYTGSDLDALTGGLLYQERLVRSTQTENLAQSIAMLAVGSAQGFDAYKTHYFDDGNLEGWIGVGITITLDAGFLAQTAITQTDYANRFIENTSVSFSGAKYSTVKLRVKRVAGSGWNWQLKFRANGSWQVGVTATSQTIAVGEFAEVNFDLSGVTGWTGGTITGLQIYTSATTSDLFSIDYIAVGRIGPGASTVSVAEEAQARIAADGALQAQYTVKIDNNGYVSGFGLASTANNAAPFSEFAIVADRFSIAPVATNPNVEDGSPFFYLTAPTLINGVTVPAGAYMKTAYIADASITNAKIGNLAADKITTGNIAADRMSANAIEAVNLSASYIDANRIDVDTLVAKLASIDEAYISSANIEDAAITNAKIEDAAITNAKIGDYIASSNFDGSVVGDAIVSNGATGWAIAKNGGAVFNSGMFRGQLDVKSAAGGARMEIKNNVIKVYDELGNLRVQMGDLTA